MYTVPLNDGAWHSVCLTWSKNQGPWKFYVDGAMRASETGFQPKHVIPQGGTLIVGQIQNTKGEFSAAESFVGNISRVNFWDIVLNESEIFSMSRSCGGEIGSAVAWKDILDGVQGNLRVKALSECTGKLRKLAENKYMNYYYYYF